MNPNENNYAIAAVEVEIQGAVIEIANNQNDHQALIAKLGFDSASAENTYFLEGHIGFVERIDGDNLVTVEGNIAASGVPGRNGVCVARSTHRRTTDTNLIGYVRY